MKQGTSFLLPVEFDYDLNGVERVEFLFVQGKKQLAFTYPSERARRVNGENVIELIWREEDTWLFQPSSTVKMDTKITVADSDYNPETEILRLVFAPTLFERVSADG